MATIHIASYCGTARVSRADGARLRQAIVERWGNEPVTLDFSGVRIASISFLDEAIGVLALEHALDALTRRLSVVHIDPPDRELLNRIVSQRSRERERKSTETAQD